MLNVYIRILSYTDFVTLDLGTFQDVDRESAKSIKAKQCDLSAFERDIVVRFREMKQHFASVQRKLEEDMLVLKTRNVELRQEVTCLKKEKGNLRQTVIQLKRERGDLRRTVSQHIAVQDANPVEINEENQDREKPRNKHGGELRKNSPY